MFQSFLFNLCLPYFPFLSVESFYCPINLFRGVLAYFVVQFFGDMVQLYFKLLLADCGNDCTLDILANLFDFVMTVHYGANHIFVGNFVCARLNHKNSVLGARKVEVDGACAALS